VPAIFARTVRRAFSRAATLRDVPPLPKAQAPAVRERVGVDYFIATRSSFRTLRNVARGSQQFLRFSHFARKKTVDTYRHQGNV
jgi:hypothetical protein